MKRFVAGLLMSIMVLGSAMTVSAQVQNFDGVMFDPEYYANMNPDVLAAVGYNPELLFAHYVNFGAAEGRAAFDPADLDDEMVDDTVSFEDMVANLVCLNTPAPVVPGVTPRIPIKPLPEDCTLERGLGVSVITFEIFDVVDPQAVLLEWGWIDNRLDEEEIMDVTNSIFETADFIRGDKYTDIRITKVEWNTPTQYTFYFTNSYNGQKATSAFVIDFDKNMHPVNVWQLVAPKWVPAV